METDEATAAIVFATLNTTRARIDLIERLAKIKVGDKQMEKKLDDIVERFNDSTRMRNEFNHCMYVLDERGRDHPHKPYAGAGGEGPPSARHRASHG